MCIIFYIEYPCCRYTTTAYSTHCQSSGKDGINGNPALGCREVVEGPPQLVDYPCPNHSGLRRQDAAAFVRRPSSDWKNGWSGAKPTQRHQPWTRTVQDGVHLEALRRRWARDPHRYEVEYPDMTPASGTATEWNQYLNASADVTGRPNHKMANDYWNDPQPWGHMRHHGRLMSDAERAEEAVLEEMYDANGNLREEVFAAHPYGMPRG